MTVKNGIPGDGGPHKERQRNRGLFRENFATLPFSSGVWKNASQDYRVAKDMETKNLEKFSTNIQGSQNWLDAVDYIVIIKATRAITSRMHRTLVSLSQALLELFPQEHSCDLCIPSEMHNSSSTFTSLNKPVSFTAVRRRMKWCNASLAWMYEGMLKAATADWCEVCDVLEWDSTQCQWRWSAPYQLQL